MFVSPNQQKVWATSEWSTFLNGMSSNPAGKIERDQWGIARRPGHTAIAMVF